MRRLTVFALLAWVQAASPVISYRLHFLEEGWSSHAHDPEDEDSSLSSRRADHAGPTRKLEPTPLFECVPPVADDDWTLLDTDTPSRAPLCSFVDDGFRCDVATHGP